MPSYPDIIISLRVSLTETAKYLLQKKTENSIFITCNHEI